jgi:hypothetical protein
MRRGCIDAGLCRVRRVQTHGMDGTRPPGHSSLSLSDIQLYILYISTELLENKGFRDVPQDVCSIDPASRWPSPWAQEAGNHPPRPHNTPAPDNHALDAPRAPGPLIPNQRPQARRPAPGSVRADLLGHKARQFSKPRRRFSNRGYRSSVLRESGRFVPIVRSVGARGYRQNLRSVTTRDPSPPAIRTECLERFVRSLVGNQP